MNILKRYCHPHGETYDFTEWLDGLKFNADILRKVVSEIHNNTIFSTGARHGVSPCVVCVRQVVCGVDSCRFCENYLPKESHNPHTASPEDLLVVLPKFSDYFAAQNREADMMIGNHEKHGYWGHYEPSLKAVCTDGTIYFKDGSHHNSCYKCVVQEKAGNIDTCLDCKYCMPDKKDSKYELKLSDQEKKDIADGKKIEKNAAVIRRQILERNPPVAGKEPNLFVRMFRDIQ